jgi:hypothetical protein
MMSDIKGHSHRRRPDVHKGDCAFQFVVPGFVEQVTQSDDADGLPGKVDSQARGAPGKDTRNRI